MHVITMSINLHVKAHIINTINILHFNLKTEEQQDHTTPADGVGNTGPFVFRAPLVGSPPSIVCPSPVRRSFRESISRRTVMLAQ